MKKRNILVLLLSVFFIMSTPLSASEAQSFLTNTRSKDDIIEFSGDRVSFDTKVEPGEYVGYLIVDGENPQDAIMTNSGKADDTGIYTFGLSNVPLNKLFTVFLSTDLDEKHEFKNDSKVLNSFSFIRHDEQILETDDAIWNFKEVELLPGTMLAEKIVAIEVEFTNKTDLPQNAWMQFVLDFVGEQEVDGIIYDLSGANAEYASDYKPEFVRNADIDVEIAPGKTVTVVVGYSLEDPNEPVYIRDRNMFGKNGEKLEIKVSEDE